MNSNPAEQLGVEIRAMFERCVRAHAALSQNYDYDGAKVVVFVVPGWLCQPLQAAIEEITGVQGRPAPHPLDRLDPERN